jgi:hypothetical protein
MTPDSDAEASNTVTVVSNTSLDPAPRASPRDFAVKRPRVEAPADRDDGAHNVRVTGFIVRPATKDFVQQPVRGAYTVGGGPPRQAVAQQAQHLTCQPEHQQHQRQDGAQGAAPAAPAAPSAAAQQQPRHANAASFALQIHNASGRWLGRCMVLPHTALRRLAAAMSEKLDGPVRLRREGGAAIDPTLTVQEAGLARDDVVICET